MATRHGDNRFGDFLKGRRTKLDPASLGYPMTRRRTPGLRREEVAQRANISATWYTWLEQGRGGTPSADVLDRLARGLALNEAEREHLFLLAQNRPPEIQYKETPGVTPQLQRVIDSLELSPAYVRTSEWEVLAWNQAARAVLGDYGALPEGKRNILRLFFSEPEVRTRISHWDSVARSMVATFRAETAKTGASQRVKALVDELSRSYPDFEALWLDHAVSALGEGIKSIEHPTIGPIKLEYSTFVVEGMPNLSMVIFNPVKPGDKAGVLRLMEIFSGRDQGKISVSE
jgi:transcriptional regulator with XRE-family HTH domain